EGVGKSCGGRTDYRASGGAVMPLTLSLVRPYHTRAYPFTDSSRTVRRICMARFTLSLLLGFLVCSPSAYAQGSKELTACPPQGNEILVEIIDGDHLLIRIFDAEGNHIYPSLAPGSPLYHTILPRTACDWYGATDPNSVYDWLYEPDKL